MRYFGCLLLLATLAFANFDLFKRDDCNKMNIAACRDAIRIKETNCDMYDNDSDYESDTEQEFYAKIQEDRCECSLDDEYYVKWSQCAKECGARVELQPELLKSSVCSKALRVPPNSQFANYVSSMDRVGTPAWSRTTDLSSLRNADSSSSQVASSTSDSGSSSEESSGSANSSSAGESTTSNGSSTSAASRTEPESTTESSSDTTDESSTDGSSSNDSATTESTTTSSESSSTNFAVTAGCGSLLSLILLSLL